MAQEHMDHRRLRTMPTEVTGCLICSFVYPVYSQGVPGLSRAAPLHECTISTGTEKRFKFHITLINQLNMSRTFFVGGNFKMNGTTDTITKIVDGLNQADLPKNVEVVIAPPAPYLSLAVKENKQSTVEVGAQNVFNKGPGAFTGEIAPQQLKDLGVNWAIIGHSERRTIIKESNEFIADKTKYALDEGVKVILCIGEVLEERENGTTLKVCATQLDAVADKVQDWSNVVVAYEPVWAIGTGKAATPEDAQETHKGIRDHLKNKIGAQADSVRILYGGSVNGKNATSFKDKPDVDGFLVGGASLKPEFIDIIKSRL